MVYKEEEIVQIIRDYFESMFSSSPGNSATTINSALSPIITEEDIAILTSIPTALEIRVAAFSIHADKATGPDGLSAGFFHTHWDKIGPDIVNAVQGFFNGAPLHMVLMTHIQLIPKITNPQKISNYHPIALCNVYYKIYSKLLTRRLQPSMDKLISENQSAFVHGRAIGDNILITHEVLHYLKISKAEQQCAIAVKTDMSNAYDQLEWDFITLVLARLGFHRRLISLIIQCISSVTYSFFSNGLPRGKVVPSRRIRQGDPLPPYIFIMCSEVLYGLCNIVQEEELIQGVKVARGCPRINHLLFADDTIFFLDANESSCEALTALWNSYEEALGQSINTEKSAITFSKRMSTAQKDSIKNFLSIQKEGGVGKYMGLPEHVGRKKCNLFSSYVDWIKKKARGWSNKFIS